MKAGRDTPLTPCSRERFDARVQGIHLHIHTQIQLNAPGIGGHGRERRKHFAFRQTQLDGQQLRAVGCGGGCRLPLCVLARFMLKLLARSLCPGAARATPAIHSSCSPS